MSMGRRDLLYYLMIPGLFVAALVQSTMLSRIEVRNVKPDLVLIVVLVGTLVYGAQSGLLWAFVGGVALDLFSGGPMGSSSLALMVAALVAAPGHHTLSRFHIIVPLGAAALGTLAYGLTYIMVLFALDFIMNLPFVRGVQVEGVQHLLPFVATLEYVVLPSVAYNTLVMLALIPLLNRVPETTDAAL